MLKGQNSAIKIFKIGTLQPLVAHHFSKIVIFEKIKILGKYANKRQSSIHKNLIRITLELFFIETKNSSYIIILQVVIDS